MYQLLDAGSLYQFGSKIGSLLVTARRGRSQKKASSRDGDKKGGHETGSNYCHSVHRLQCHRSNRRTARGSQHTVSDPASRPGTSRNRHRSTVHPRPKQSRYDQLYRSRVPVPSSLGCVGINWAALRPLYRVSPQDDRQQLARCERRVRAELTHWLEEELVMLLTEGSEKGTQSEEQQMDLVIVKAVFESSLATVLAEAALEPKASTLHNGPRHRQHDLNDCIHGKGPGIISLKELSLLVQLHTLVYCLSYLSQYFTCIVSCLRICM